MLPRFLLYVQNLLSSSTSILTFLLSESSGSWYGAEGVFYDDGDEGIVSNLTYEEGDSGVYELDVDNWDGLDTATQEDAPIDTSAVVERGEVDSDMNVTKKDKQSEDGNLADW